MSPPLPPPTQLASLAVAFSLCPSIVVLTHSPRRLRQGVYRIFNQQDEWLTAETQRLTAALTRTQLTQRSCEVRLALADRLHRHLQRDSLRLHLHPLAFHDFCQQRSVAMLYFMLQAVLRGQLHGSELCRQASSATHWPLTNATARA